jgi:hypothetical protein
MNRHKKERALVLIAGNGGIAITAANVMLQNRGGIDGAMAILMLLLGAMGAYCGYAALTLARDDEPEESATEKNFRFWEKLAFVCVLVGVTQFAIRGGVVLFFDESKTPAKSSVSPAALNAEPARPTAEGIADRQLL